MSSSLIVSSLILIASSLILIASFLIASSLILIASFLIASPLILIASSFILIASPLISASLLFSCNNNLFSLSSLIHSSLITASLFTSYLLLYIQISGKLTRHVTRQRGRGWRDPFPTTLPHHPVLNIAELLHLCRRWGEPHLWC